MYEILFPMVFLVERARRRGRAQRTPERASASRKCCISSFWTGWLWLPPSSLTPNPFPDGLWFDGPVLSSRKSKLAFKSRKWSGCLRLSPPPSDLSCPLDFLPVFTEGDGVDLNGWSWMVLSMAGGRGPRAAADLQKAFAPHPGCGAGWSVFGHCSPGRSTGQGREKLPFTDPIRLGDFIEGLSWAHRDAHQVPVLPLQGVAGRVQGVAQGTFGRLLSAETLNFQDILKGLFELLTGAGVYNGIDAAVYVSEPKNYFKNCFWGLEIREERPWKKTHRFIILFASQQANWLGKQAKKPTNILSHILKVPTTLKCLTFDPLAPKNIAPV